MVRAAGLGGLVHSASEQARDPEPGDNRVLPVRPELRGLLPERGLRRGSTIAVSRRTGGTSVLLALLSTASAGGAWCAVVGMPALGAVAAAEMGICLDRFALIPYPGPEWTAVVAALLDGFDLVVTAPPGHVATVVATRLAARARQRGSVLIAHGQWSGADVVLEPVDGAWAGLGQGHGRLARRELRIAARGRGAAARPRHASLLLPDPVLVDSGVASGTVGPAPRRRRGWRVRRGGERLMRTLLIWCPDWPVIAAELIDGMPAHAPVAVLHANRVLACSEAARREGVRRGLRRREAQGRCPGAGSWWSTTRGARRAGVRAGGGRGRGAGARRRDHPAGRLRAGRPGTGPVLRRRGGRRRAAGGAPRPGAAGWRRRSASPTGSSPPVLAARPRADCPARRYRRLPGRPGHRHAGST